MKAELSSVMQKYHKSLNIQIRCLSMIASKYTSHRRR